MTAWWLPWFFVVLLFGYAAMLTGVHVARPGSALPSLSWFLSGLALCGIACLFAIIAAPTGGPA